MTIQHHFLSQTLNIVCAICGENNQVSNSKYDDETEDYKLISAGHFIIKKMNPNGMIKETSLFFYCQYCNREYEIPFNLKDYT